MVSDKSTDIEESIAPYSNRKLLQRVIRNNRQRQNDTDLIKFKSLPPGSDEESKGRLGNSLLVQQLHGKIDFLSRKSRQQVCKQSSAQTYELGPNKPLEIGPLSYNVDALENVYSNRYIEARTPVRD